MRRHRAWLWIGLATLLVAPVACLTTAALVRRGGEARFRAQCDAIRIGMPLAVAGRDLDARGDVVIGTTSSDETTITSKSWSRRTGLSRLQSCRVQLDAASTVAGRDYDIQSDYESCSNPRSHPRRYWLCRIGAAIAP